MSSSKVFKSDTRFTRIPLVQRQLEQAADEESASATTASGEEAMPAPPESVAAQTPPGQTEAHQPDAQVEPAFTVEDIQALKEEAYSQGVADASAQHQSALLHTIEAFHKACQGVHSLHRTVLDHSRGEMINLVIALSSKVLGRELEVRRDVIAATLQKVLDNAIESDEFIITINPEDHAAAEEKVPDLIASVRGLEHIVFKFDPGISRGGCHLESKICSVDATIETQLDAARDFLEANGRVLLPPEPVSPDPDTLEAGPATRPASE